MRRILGVLAGLGILCGTAGCGGAAGPATAGDVGDPFVAALRGTWWECVSTAISSRHVATTVTGPSTGTELQYSQVVNEYAVAACAGAPASTRSGGSGTIHVGPGLLANLDGARVTARRIDVTGSPDPGADHLSAHDIAHVRTDVTPARLYLGDKRYGLDGTTAETRPVDLWPSAWLVRD